MNTLFDDEKLESERYIEARMRYEALQKGLSHFHDSEYILNLDEDSYLVYKAPDVIRKIIPKEGRKSDFEKIFIGMLENSGVIGFDSHKSILDEFKLKISSDWMRQNLGGSRIVEIDYGRPRDGEEKWFRMTMFSIESNDEGLANVISVFTMEITNNVRELLNLQSQLKTANESLEKEISIIRSFRNIYDLSVLIDIKNASSSIIDANPRIADRLKGFEKKIFPLQKEVVETLVDEEFQQSLYDFLKSTKLQERMINKHLLIYEFKSKSNRWFRANLVPVNKDSDGSFHSFICAIQEITDEKAKELQYQRALVSAVRSADKANLAKTEFLSQMSHDIRTPLNAIIGFSDLILTKGGCREEVELYAKKILSSSHQLLSIVNEILDISKIESGKIELNLSVFNLRESINSIENVIKGLAKEKNQKFDVIIEGLQYLNYEGDETRLNQVLINLLGNSVKYTDNGGHISLKIYPLQTFTGRYEKIEFVVEDNGRGMSKEFIKKAFKPFTREIKSGQNSVQGTGLGLAITKNLVSLMGGTIGVESEEKKGSKFTVMIPLRPVDEKSVGKGSDLTKEETSAYIDSLKGLKILVAEDNALNGEIMGEILKMNGADFELAKDGKIAFEKFRDSPVGTFDLILMDIQMPVMDGLQSAREIRKLGAHKKFGRPDASKIPIIAVTANAFSDDVQNALAAGMNGHVSKPINVDLLKKKVAEVLKSNYNR